MGYRDRSNDQKSGNYEYCIMEVRLKKRDAPVGSEEDCRFLVVDSHYETLSFVQDNMRECVGNIVKMKRLEAKHSHRVDENATLFERRLEPLVSTLAATSEEGVLNKLSLSLKKALLLMVMTRFHSDREMACQVLGISQEKLEKELKLCGVGR